jgi:hypothetical protein
MSMMEDKFENFLIKNNIEYIRSYQINDIPFTKRKTHLVDFYLPEKDLYIEIKGFMTLYQINVLKYLHHHTEKSFYILQMTEEDWIDPYNNEKHKSITNKINMNVEKQFNEIKTLNNNQLSYLSISRLDNYIKYRNNDINRWLDQK